MLAGKLTEAITNGVIDEKLSFLYEKSRRVGQSIAAASLPEIKG